MNCSHWVSGQDTLARTGQVMVDPLSTSDQMKRLFEKKLVPEVHMDRGTMRR